MKIFRFIFSFIICFVLSKNSFSKVAVGFKGGVNLSKLEYNLQDFSINSYRITTFTGGLPIEIKLSRNFALQPEINYLSTGGKVNSTLLQVFGAYEFKRKINLIEVPVLCKFSIGNEKNKLDLYAGPVFAYAMNGKKYIMQQNNGVENSYEFDFGDNALNRFDFSLNLGIGTSVATGNNTLFFKFHYQVSLTQMKIYDEYFSNDFSINNNNLIFTIGILSPFTIQRHKIVG